MIIEIPDDIFTKIFNNVVEQKDETVCHCEIKENAELIADILNTDSEGRYFFDNR